MMHTQRKSFQGRRCGMLKSRIAKKVAQQPSSNFEVYSKNTIGENTKSLNVEASLKLSLMSGMIEIDDAGKYTLMMSGLLKGRPGSR